MAALHRRADLAVVTPLHDGMNLVAKEHILHRGAIHDRPGALVLSQFAGAAYELKEAFLVNPFLPESICDGIERAMDSSALEKRSRMAKLVTRVKAWTATDWARRLIDVTREPSRRIAAL
jgi:trehalose-6-phosphate synthase